MKAYYSPTTTCIHVEVKLNHLSKTDKHNMLFELLQEFELQEHMSEEFCAAWDRVKERDWNNEKI